MGLDMYLYAEQYVSRVDYNQPAVDYDFPPNPAFQAIVEALNFDTKILENGSHAGISIDLPIGYWRKANQIHGWIINNCADGVDECQRIPIHRSTLNELLETCIMALATKDPSLLPPSNGFFFGSNDIDEYYWQDIERTIKILTDALSIESDFYYYQASW